MVLDNSLNKVYNVYNKKERIDSEIEFTPVLKLGGQREN